jgi:hypothetical protein
MRVGVVAIVFRTNLSDIRTCTQEAVLDKRDRFISQLRTEARAHGLPFNVTKGRGKGGHAMIWIGDRVSTLPSREIDPKTAAKIRKTLGLD